jgi:cell division protein FtsQ
MPRDDAQLIARVAPLRVDLTRDEPSSPDDFEANTSRLDLDDQEEPKFLRAQKRVPVRRGALPKKAASRIKLALVLCSSLALMGTGYGLLYRYGTHSWRFRLESSDNISLEGLQNVSRSQVMDVFGADLGRNVFFVPLDERKKQLEEIPWVESAAVSRLLPDRLTVYIRERTPVAFVQIGSRIGLIDARGVLMDLPRNAKYSFPVIRGVGEAEPLSTRTARMKIYSRLVRELDADGAHYSKDLSEVDLYDPEDVKVTTSDPAGAVLIHLGSEQFLERYKVYMAHVQEWRQQFHKLESVDLRYDRQIIVNPDSNVGAEPRRK